MHNQGGLSSKLEERLVREGGVPTKTTQTQDEYERDVTHSCSHTCVFPGLREGKGKVVSRY